MRGREAQVADERVDLALDHRRRGRVGGVVVGGERLQARACGCDRARIVEDPPVACLQLAVQPLGQLRRDVARSACTVQRCSSAAGQSSRAAFQRPGAPSAIRSAGGRAPRASRSRPKSSQSS